MRDPTLKIRLAVIFISLSVTMGASALTPDQAELAPGGNYISNTPARGLPPPANLYETRLVWIMAAFRDNVAPRGPIERQLRIARLLSEATLPPVARQALDREMAAVRALPDDDRATYLRALIRDLTTLELTDLDNQLTSRVTAAAFSDFIASVIVTAALGRTLDEMVDKARAVIIANKGAGKVALRARVRASVQSATVRARAFDSYRARFGHSLDERQLLSDFMRSRMGDRPAAPVSFAMADLLMDRATQTSEASQLLLKQDLMNILLDATPGPVAGAAIGSRGRGSMAIMRMRHQAVLQYLSIRCGCTSPRGSKLAAPAAWEAFLPPVNQTYQTRVGRLLAAGPKTGFQILRGDVRYRQELDRVGDMCVVNPTQCGAFLAHFAQDIDALQAEFIEEASSTYGFVEDLALSTIASIVTPPGTAASTVVTMLVSAGFSGLAEYGNLSAERKVMVQMETLRNETLDALERLASPCGCNAKLAVVPVGTRQGN